MSQSTQEKTPQRQPMTYHDFHVRFSDYNETDGTFKVWVEGETLGGTMKPADAAVCTYDPNAFWRDPESGRGGLIGDLDRRRLKRDGLFTLGTMLSDLALPSGKVRSLFEKSLVALQAGTGLRIRLHLDAPELAQLPWEYMALAQTSGEPQATDFLALRREISIVRTDTVESAQRPLPERNTALVAGVFSSPDDQDELDLEKEQQVIATAVQALNTEAEQELISVKWTERPATRDEVVRVLADGADIFHFAGHGQFDTYNSAGKLLLESPDYDTDAYDAEQLAQLLGHAGVRLVILGACESGRRDGKNVWTGVAPALTRQKIPAVIANQFKIRDDSAILLISKVYPLLFAGYTIDEALFAARQSIYQKSGLEKYDWGVPVLYMHDKDGVLFPLPEAETRKDGSQVPFVRVANTFGTVAGTVVDVVVENMTRGHLEVKDSVDKVEKGAEFTSVKITNLG